MKNIFLIFIIISINGISKGQGCSSITDIYGQIGENLTLKANLNINPHNIIHQHWERDGIFYHNIISYIITGLSHEDGGMYTYSVEYHCPETNTDIEMNFCFQVHTYEPSEDNHPQNEIIIDIETMSVSAIAELKDSLGIWGFMKMDSCLCSTMELWIINAAMPSIEMESTIKRAEEKVDRDGGKSSRNFFAVPDVPLYCMEESQYKWLPPPPSDQPHNEMVDIAILDNGFDTSLFPGHLWTGTSSVNPCCNNSTSDPNGYNALDECSPVNPGEHGTVVASTMASFVPDNIPYRMMNLKAVDQRKGSLFRVACAAKYAMRSGVDIINFSMGYYGERSSLLDTLIGEAKDNGILVIASSGNGGQGKYDHWPSNYSKPVYGYDNVISVGSTNSVGQQANFSSNADIYAPGHNLVCRGIDNIPVLKSGTSFSTAFVTAAAASCLSENPSLNPSEVIDMLTDPNSGWSSGQTGFIKLDVNIIEESNSISFQENLVINETIANARIFDAKISIESSATLLDGADVSMRTGENILFLPGFKSNSGSILLATIKGCDEGSNPCASSAQNKMKEPAAPLAIRDQADFKDRQISNSDGLRVVPNPFHGQTTISFDLGKEVFLELNIYSALGQKIKTLARGQYEKGGYEIVFNANDIPPGVYYANLVKGGVLVTRKIVLR